MSQWQYLAHVEPIFPVQSVQEVHYHQPVLPDLPPQRSGLAIALLVAACALVVPLQAPAATLDWHGEISQPQRVSSSFDFQTGAERPLTPIPFKIAGWDGALSQPSERPYVLTGTGAEAPLSVPPFQRTDWFPQFPDLLAQGLQTPGTGAEFIPPAARGAVGWTAEFGVPTFSPFRTFETGAERPLSVPFRIFDWLSQLSQPQRASWTPIGTGAERPTFVPPQVLDWLPQRVAIPLRTLEYKDYSTGAEYVRSLPSTVIIPLEWARPLSEPTRLIVPCEVYTGAEFIGVPQATIYLLPDNIIVATAVVVEVSRTQVVVQIARTLGATEITRTVTFEG